MPEETRQLVLLFVDVPSAVHVRDQRGNDAATDFLAEVTAQIGRVRKQHGGQEVRSVGSTVLSSSSSPGLFLSPPPSLPQPANTKAIIRTRNMPTSRMGSAKYKPDLGRW